MNDKRSQFNIMNDPILTTWAKLVLNGFAEKENN